MTRPLRELSPAQIEEFIAHGLVRVENALPKEFCEREVKKMWVRLGMNPDDRATWTVSRTNMPTLDQFPFETHAPRAYNAIRDLLGGEDRIKKPCVFCNNMIPVFNNAKEPWAPPGPSSPGWHKDGDWFTHFLDSPEQALLIIVIWSDIEPRGGGTYFACDSVKHVARHYANKPEGGSLQGPDYQHILSQCTDFRELTGKAGDIVLMHPYMVHAVSINTRPEPRIICNVCVSLNEPMNFDRPNRDDFSAVELSVLRALGVDRLDFRITGQRGRVATQREVEWEKRRVEERARLAAAGLA